MSSLKNLFTTIPAPGTDEDGEEQWRRRQRWFNRCYEHSGTRLHVLAGDIATDGEYESGGRAPVALGAEINLCQEDVPEFYLPDNEKAVYDIHTFTAVVWRWGIYLAIRGRANV